MKSHFKRHWWELTILLMMAFAITISCERAEEDAPREPLIQEENNKERLVQEEIIKEIPETEGPTIREKIKRIKRSKAL